MKSRWLLNLVLLALVAALGLMLYRYGDDDDIPRLTGLDARIVDAIEIQHRDRYVVLKRHDKGWTMTRPIQIRGNEIRIEALLKLISMTTNARYHVDDIDLGRYGLDQPRTSIRLSAGTDTVKIDFGKANPINRMRYVRAGDSMHLIEDNFYPLVSSQLGTLIAPALLPENAEITALSIPRHTLVRDGSDWRITPDIKGMDSDMLNTLVDNWQHAQAFGVHDYLPREQLGTVHIDYRLKDATGRLDLVITDTDPWLILAAPALGIEYHLDISQYDALLSPGHQLDSDVLDAEQQKLGS